MLCPAAIRCTPHANTSRHAPDDPAEHALPRDGVSDRLPAPAWLEPGAHGNAGRRIDRTVPATVFGTASRPHGGGAAPAGTQRAEERAHAAADQTFPRACGEIRRNRRTGDSLPAASRSQSG